MFLNVYICINLLRVLREKKRERGAKIGRAKVRKVGTWVSSEFVQLTRVCKFCTFPAK